MVQFRDIVNELLRRLRGTRAAGFIPSQSPPPAPAPILPRPPAFPQPPSFPQKTPIRLPPMPAGSPPALPVSAMIYPRESNTWGAEGGWAPTTSGFETRVFEPPRQKPKVEHQVVAFSIFDDLFDS